jgi:RyR domain
VEQGSDKPRKPRPITSTRVLFLVMVAVALGCGYWGLRLYIASLPAADQAGLGRAPLNLFYYDLQLFVLGSKPLEGPGQYNPWLYVAMFAAPAATVLALYEAARALFSGQLRRWRMRRRLGHAIVIGDTTAARELVSWFTSGTVHRVAEFSPEALDAAGVAGAEVVYACADDSDNGVVNVVIAQAAATAPRRGTQRRRVYAQVSSPNLALGLRARWLGGLQGDTPDVDFFNIDELAARDSLRPSDFLVAEGVQPHIVVAGLSAFGRAILVEYGRLWPVRSGHADTKVRVTVAGAEQSEVDSLVRQWRPICDIFEFVVVDGELSTVVTDPPHRTFICYDDENRALEAALTAAQLWRSGPDSVVIRLDRLAAHDVFAAATGPGPADRPSLLDNVRGTLRFIGVTRQACRPELIGQDLLERLAENIHLGYLTEQARRRNMVMWDRPTMRPWDEVDEDTRSANYDPARDVGTKLAMIGATVAPRVGAVEEFSFTGAEVELLAVHEHARWSAERTRSGWTRGPRDNAAKKHPSLVSWEALSDDEKEKDREAVRGLVDALGAVGLRIVRLNPSSSGSPPVPLSRAATVGS